MWLLKYLKSNPVKTIKQGYGITSVSSIYFLYLAFTSDFFEREIETLSAILLIIPAVIIAYVIEKNNAKKRKYFSLIEKQRVLSVESIASACSVTYEKAYKDIIKMIDRGFFGDAYIDNATQKIVISNADTDINAQAVERSVQCPSCGATNKVSSLGESKCEYCGTILQ